MELMMTRGSIMPIPKRNDTVTPYVTEPDNAATASTANSIGATLHFANIRTGYLYLFALIMTYQLIQQLAMCQQQ